MTCPSEPAQPAGAPLRRSLALTLRDLRRTRSLRLEDVATRLGIAPSTLSRIETGQAPARVSYVTIMLDIYGINDTEERAELIRLAAQSQHQPWWHDYDNLLTPGTGHYLDLEYAATTIRTFTARLIPDLLQTPAYAAAAIAAARPCLRTDDITRLLALHTTRRELHARTRTTLHAIIDPAAITTPITSPHIMQTQINCLAATAATPRVTLQITRPAPPLTSPPFTLLTFTDNPDRPGISCCPAPAGHLVINRKNTTYTDTRAIFDTLTRTALTPAASLAVLTELANQ